MPTAPLGKTRRHRLADGSEIAFEVYGEGPPLLMLHGYSQSRISWRPVAQTFDGYQAVLVDLPGHGDSSPFARPLSVRDVAQQLCEFCDALALQRCDALAFSFGGDVLFQAILKNASLVRSMVAIGATGSWRAKDFPAVLELFNRKNVDLAEYQTSDEQIDTLFDEFSNYDAYVTNDELASISVRVLLAVGENDSVILKEEVRRADDCLPDSEVWIEPGASDALHLEHPEKFADKAQEFLRK